MARKLYCERIFFLGLFLAHDLLCANLPAKILKNIEADPKIRNLAGEVYGNLYQKNDELTKLEISNRFFSFHIKMKDRHLDKIRHVLLMVIRPTKEDWRCFPLSASISFLHYMLRSIRLAVELVGMYFGRLFKLQRPRDLSRVFHKSSFAPNPDLKYTFRRRKFRDL